MKVILGWFVLMLMCCCVGASPKEKPTPPTNLRQFNDPTTKMVGIVWDAPVNWGSGEASTRVFRTYYRLTGKPEWTFHNQIVGTIYQDYFSLLTDESYDFKVEALTEHGGSRPSNVITIIGPPTI